MNLDSDADRAKQGRAKPLGREARRSAILDATIPLLMEHGRGVTSKQIAQAAGIAEGTIYRVFDDKDELLAAALHRHTDASTIARQIGQIAPELSLTVAVEHTVTLLQTRVREIFGLMVALDFWARAREGGSKNDGRTDGAAHHKPPESAPVIAAIAGVLQRYSDELRMPAQRAANVIRLTTLSMTHPLLTEGESFTAQEITAILLNGMTVSSTHTASAASASTYSHPTHLTKA